MTRCPSCDTQDIPNIFVGDQLFGPDENNNIYLPAAQDGAGVVTDAGSGIEIVDGVASVCLEPSDDNAIQIVNGCLFVPSADSSPDFEPTNGTTTAGGIDYITGGNQGHGGTFNVVVSSDSEISSPGYGPDGGLLLDEPEDTQWQGYGGENIVVAAGDNPGGSVNNGHRPEISVRPGAALCPPLEFRCTENANGTFQVEIVNPNTGGSISLGGAF